MGTPFQLAASAGTSYGAAGVNRWGDYFQVVVDPVDDATFWGVAVVANSASSWQTVVNSWTITPPAVLVSNSIPTTIPGGATAVGTVTLDSPAPQLGYVVTLVSSDSAAASVPASVTVPSGATSANYTITTSADGSDRSATITATLRGVNKPATTTVLGGGLQGTVTLGDYSGPVAGQQVTIEVRAAGTATVLDTYTATLDASGHYSVSSTRSGVFDVAIKAAHWLRRVVSNVPFSGGAMVNASLINGDVNGDNSVTLSDFAQLRAAFGSSSGDATWNPNADLNGDGAVSLGDFAVLRSRFGQSGDN